MFDIGFAELLVIGVVGLVVIGPERLPEAIRTGSQWLNHFRRSFNSIKREIQQELDADSVKQQLLKANHQIKQDVAEFKYNLEGTTELTDAELAADSPDTSQSAPAATTTKKPTVPDA